MSSGRLIVVSLMFLLASSSAPPSAFALSLETQAQGSTQGNNLSDPQGPASSGTLLSSIEFDPDLDTDNCEGYGNAFAISTVSDSGLAAVRASGAFGDDDDLATGGDASTLLARAIWSETVTNTGNQVVAYVFSFRISPARLKINNQFGVEKGNAAVPAAPPSARYSLSIRLNSSTLFTSSAHLEGGLADHTLTETGTDLGGTLFTEFDDELEEIFFGYDFDEFEGMLDLGNLGLGENLTVTYEMLVETTSFGEGTGSDALIGDPLDLCGVPGIAGLLEPITTLAVEESSWSNVKSLFK